MRRYRDLPLSLKILSPTIVMLLAFFAETLVVGSRPGTHVVRFWSLVGMGGVGSLILAWMAARSITRAVSELRDTVTKVAAGDLTGCVTLETKDEIGQLGREINLMILDLSGLVAELKEAARQLSAAAGTLSLSSQHAADGSVRQSEMSGTVAAAIHEMSSTVSQVAENANRASETAQQASDTAKAGASVVEGAVMSIDAISRSVNDSAEIIRALGQSSGQIGEIIGVIDDIADQTNLLALNAAIEAARAGDQGRGFAVVADEVRKLAERTSKATKEIAVMIRKIQTDTTAAVRSIEDGSGQLSGGVQKVAESGEALITILAMVEQVKSMVAQIATATTQQSSSTQEISASMESITNAARASSAGAEQAASSARELTSMATILGSRVDRFTLSL